MPAANPTFATSGEPVPEVELADLKAVWNYLRELHTQHPNQQIAVAASVYQNLCKPGANVTAVVYRCSMLTLLEHLLVPTWAGGQLTEAALAVAAKMPLQQMKTGVPRAGLPFNLLEFFARAGAEASGLNAPPDPSHFEPKQ
jgi:hypothetical protein